MKVWISHIVLMVLFILLSVSLEVGVEVYVANTFYTITGIMFSIGLGLVVTFNLSGVRNQDYIRLFRRKLNIVRNSYIQYFSLATIAYLIYQSVDKGFHMVIPFEWLNFLASINWSLLCLLVIIYTLMFNVVNFIAIQKLSNDLFDRLNTED